MWGFYYLKNEYTYEDAIKDILMRGGDTDTNAAIIGGLLGAAYGIECLKEEWCETMLNYKGPIQGGEGHARPDFLYPGLHLPQMLFSIYENAPKILSVHPEKYQDGWDY